MTAVHEDSRIHLIAELDILVDSARHPRGLFGPLKTWKYKIASMKCEKEMLMPIRLLSFLAPPVPLLVFGNPHPVLAQEGLDP